MTDRLIMLTEDDRAILLEAVALLERRGWRDVPARLRSILDRPGLPLAAIRPDTEGPWCPAHSCPVAACGCAHPFNSADED